MTAPRQPDRPAVRTMGIMVGGILATICFLMGMRAFADGSYLRGFAASVAAGFAAVLTLRFARGQRGSALLSMLSARRRRDS